MKTYTIRLWFIGLTGKYSSDVEVRARSEKSAIKKASLSIGNRDCVGTEVLRTEPA